MSKTIISKRSVIIRKRQEHALKLHHHPLLDQWRLIILIFVTFEGIFQNKKCSTLSDGATFCVRLDIGAWRQQP